MYVSYGSEQEFETFCFDKMQQLHLAFGPLLITCKTHEGPSTRFSYLRGGVILSSTKAESRSNVHSQANVQAKVPTLSFPVTTNSNAVSNYSTLLLLGS